MEPVENPLKAFDPETIEATVQRVVAIGQRLLASNASQVLGVFERQARQLLNQQNEIREYRRQITQLQQAVDQLKQQAARHIVPFRREAAKAEDDSPAPGPEAWPSGSMATIPSTPVSMMSTSKSH